LRYGVQDAEIPRHMCFFLGYFFLLCDRRQYLNGRCKFSQNSGTVDYPVPRHVDEVGVVRHDTVQCRTSSQIICLLVGFVAALEYAKVQPRLLSPGFPACTCIACHLSGRQTQEQGPRMWKSQRFLQRCQKDTVRPDLLHM
jgi:hypothetical protein